jgi:transcriptional regulator GlxA family with amidase domain
MRAGGQAQFIVPPALPRGGDGLAPTLDWATAHLDQALTVADLARRAGLSPRQLARRMQAELHATPLQWLHRQRVVRAQEMLESTDAGMEQIAARCGLGSAATLRRHFTRALGVSPAAYRATFGQLQARRAADAARGEGADVPQPSSTRRAVTPAAHRGPPVV